MTDSSNFFSPIGAIHIQVCNTAVMDRMCFQARKKNFYRPCRMMANWSTADFFTPGSTDSDLNIL